MYYYAFINESNIVTGVYSLPSQITTDGYIEITQQQYNDSQAGNENSLIGMKYNSETGEFENPVIWSGSTDEVEYKDSDTSLTTKLDAMDATIESKANSADLHSHDNKAVLDGITAAKVAAWDDGASTPGVAGEDGATFTPSVSNEGILSWTNDKGLTNPTPVNIKGANGNDGSDGADGTTVIVGTTTTGDAGTDASVTSSMDSETNTLTLNFTIPKGDTGESGTSASITAEEVLTKIKTVDGTNSGLDADMLDGKHANEFANADHTHNNYATTSMLESLSETVDGKANVSHTHTFDDVLETTSKKVMTAAERTKLNGIETGANNYVHPSTHAASMITGLANVATSGKYSDLTDIPTNFTPEAHTHAQSDITGLTAALNNKSDVNHTHNYCTLNQVYPVGSIYLSVNNANPSTLFGGTWVAFGTGKVLMGVKSGGNAEATGGSETATIAAHSHTTQSHALTIAEMPGHQHEILNYNENGYTTDTFTKNSVEGLIKKGFTGNVMTSYTGGNRAHSHGDTGSAGAATINVVQPYITCYMWKRTN